jgi:threonine synthase
MLNRNVSVSPRYARDGGLFLPETMPTVGADDLDAMLDLSFQQMFVRIASLFVGDEMQAEELEEIVEASFSTFSHEKVVPVVPVEDFHVAELFHGPTYAFKDFGQQGVPPSILSSLPPSTLLCQKCHNQSLCLNILSNL